MIHLAAVAVATVLSASSSVPVKAISLANEGPNTALYSGDWATSPVDATAMIRIVRNVCEIEDIAPLSITSIRAVDLDADGKNELVVAPDQGCTGCPAMLVIFRRSEGGISAWKVATENGDVDRDVLDVDGDGIPEVRTRELLATSLSHTEAVFWPHLFRLKDGQLAQSDGQYRKFYRNHKRDWLEIQRKTLAETPESVAKRDGKDTSWGERWIRYRTADLQVGIDKVDRLLGEKKAGFKQAVEWWDSGDKALMRNAITTFGDVRDATCVDYLRKAVKEPDSDLAILARSRLADSFTR